MEAGRHTDKLPKVSTGQLQDIAISFFYPSIIIIINKESSEVRKRSLLPSGFCLQGSYL